MSTQRLWISDASPLFFYSPADAYFSGQNLSPWTGSDSSSSTTKRQIGGTVAGGSTYHSATGSAGVILPSIYATSFAPIFNANDYNVTLQINSDDSQSWETAQNWTASDGEFNQQTFTVQSSCGVDGGCQDAFEFQGAWVETQMAPSGSDTESVTLDDGSELVQYSGFSPIDSNNEIVQVSSNDHNSTLSMTSTAGATAQVVFNGASISIMGVVCPSCSTFTVTLDGTVAATLDTSNNVTVHDTLLFFTTNLDPSSTHTMSLEAQGGLVIDNFVAYGPEGGVGFIGTVAGSTATLSPSGTGATTTTGATATSTSVKGTSGGAPNVGVIIGAVLGSLAGVVLLWFACRKAVQAKTQGDDKKLDPWDEANMLQNQKNEGVHVTTAANQRYVYPGLIAHSDLKKK
ncbi:hypothetical protein I350_00476 [Cryptococcus amylolentus CBS 6273]|uniref:Uncharacterized protein n=1 Tax=Cryptococcus amylolentus CBS 6273 TaxID=1296118 RepID=A0A1E3KHA6_9TREE|nr:hypothetical protein I350_00476 [Cryptococcus amylolentus CBS 6273]